MVPSIRVSGRGLIFWHGKQYLDIRTESTKQSDDPESTKAMTGTGIEGSESSTCNDFKQVIVAMPRYSTIFLAEFKQSTLQDMSWLLGCFLTTLGNLLTNQHRTCGPLLAPMISKPTWSRILQGDQTSHNACRVLGLCSVDVLWV